MFWTRLDTRRYFIPTLVGLIVLAWLALILWGRSPYAGYLSHKELHGQELSGNANAAGVALLFVLGWTAMTVAMMLPTSLPLFDLFQRLVRRRPDASRLTALLIAGYVTVWSAFGVVAHTGDRFIHLGVDHIGWLAANPQVIPAAVLVLAGVYQFTPLKYMCLDKCRSPLSFITEHWHGRRERAEAFKLGLHHGLFCVGCCWSLMLLMLAVGTGNIGWMLGLGAVMAIEKNMPWGRRLSAPLGVLLLAAGFALLALAAPSACAHSLTGC